jgi:FkbH-like protein
MCLEEFYEHLAAMLDTSSSGFHTEAELDDLGWGSLAFVSFLAFAEENFAVTIEPKALARCKTVGNLIQLLDGKIGVKTTAQEPPRESPAVASSDQRRGPMKLREALETNQKQQRPGAARRLRVALVCSSTPTNLKAFLQASLIERQPDAAIQVDTTAYGDLAGSLEQLAPADYDGVAVVCEWFDLDPRLGFRRLGGWAPSVFADILATAEAAAGRLRAALAHFHNAAVSLPTLPLPPLGISAPAQADEFEIRLAAVVGSLAEQCAAQPGVRVLSSAELDRLSPAAERYDVRTDLSQGSPYKVPHASVLGTQLARLLAPAAPLKGLITDLDDTLWSGILGEVGVDGISFDLDTGGQLHGLYQQFLRSLAERGVLLAAASKNDPQLVERALARPDLLTGAGQMFPVCAGWEPKSESVGRILKAWNVGPEAVAFIDDSPMELAEVQARYPAVRTFLFPKDDPARLLELLHELRECFAKAAIREEDRIRLDTLRQTEAMERERGGTSEEAFLASVGATLEFHLAGAEGDERAFELINKTNQFNLNGRRIGAAEWAEFLRRPDNFLLTVSYADKFGPLGKIAAVLGTRSGRKARLAAWVLSCRAFSRRIEYATLRYLLDRFALERCTFDFAATERNGPVRSLFAALGVNVAAPEISAAAFRERCPQLYHGVQEKDMATHG